MQQVSVNGTPDYLLCYKGKFYAWELKVRPNKLNPESMQAFHLNRIKEAGGVGREVTPENLEEALTELLYNGGKQNVE